MLMGTLITSSGKTDQNPNYLQLNKTILKLLRNLENHFVAFLYSQGLNNNLSKLKPCQKVISFKRFLKYYEV